MVVEIPPLNIGSNQKAWTDIPRSGWCPEDFELGGFALEFNNVYPLIKNYELMYILLEEPEDSQPSQPADELI
jgi:hypothetical protein